MGKKEVKKDVKKPIIKEVVKETLKKFSKSSIINSARYINKRDAINVVLKDNQKYTLKEVDEMLEKFYKTEVK